MPNPLRHRQSFMFSDTLRLAMLMPFILYRFLKPHHIKADTMNNWRENFKLRQDSIILKLLTCWAIEAKTLKLAFSITMTENIYQELDESLKKEREMLLQVSFFLYCGQNRFRNYYMYCIVFIFNVFLLFLYQY